MFILIPLGGKGQRFKDNGFKNPKALINVFGKPILYYLLDNLNLSDIDFVYIPYNKEYTNYRFESRLIKDYPNINFKFLELSNNTRGAAETINISLKNLNNLEDMPMLLLDGDNFYTCDVIKMWNGENKVFCFSDTNEASIYSYLDVKDNKILDIVEKQKISDYACSGAYGFESYKDFIKYSQYIIDNNIKQNNEFYSSGVIKEMINQFKVFKPSLINQNDFTCLGTPFQVKLFYNNLPKISCIDNNIKIKPLRICFDLDNTLVTFPQIQGDYNSVLPIKKNIEYLRYLKKFGHTIIIYSARNMKTCQGNIGKVNHNIGKITFDTLEKFDIPYDELYFGKPYAHCYIDDLAINCFDDVEKELGFYMDYVSPRSFNEISHNSLNLYTKKSFDLSGEIYYYSNIPREIKDLFPLFIDYDINNKWYKMEEINGVVSTNLYLSELLTKDNLVHIMNSIKRIQNVDIKNNGDNINIYLNYCSKMEKRMKNYDYSKFPNSVGNYKKIYNYLKKYEEENKGRLSCIHGDPVLTNIIINYYGKIKFIDMRGQVGNKLTIYGDWLYDWAKLYQSLIGYDKILQDKEVSKEYEKKMINIFEEFFINNYSKEDLENLKYVTKSLLFTLIPLHDNEKCINYYNLINTI